MSEIQGDLPFPMVRFSVSISANDLDRLDDVSEVFGISRSAFVSTIVSTEVDRIYDLAFSDGPPSPPPVPAVPARMRGKSVSLIRDRVLSANRSRRRRS